jgi:UDP-N-acetyl-D-galactosamine dehydrogenase
VYDPWANADHVEAEYGIQVSSFLPESEKYDAIILAVAHRQFGGVDWRKRLNSNGVIYDVKGFLDREQIDGRL